MIYALILKQDCPAFLELYGPFPTHSEADDWAWVMGKRDYKLVAETFVERELPDETPLHPYH